MATTLVDAPDATVTKVLQCSHNQLRYGLETVRRDFEVDYSVLNLRTKQ